MTFHQMDRVQEYSDVLYAVALFASGAPFDGHMTYAQSQAVEREYNRQMRDLLLFQGVWSNVGMVYCPDVDA